MTIEQFLSASTALADPRNLPAVQGDREQRYDASPVRTLVLGRMLAQAAIVPSRTGQITVGLAGGDDAMFAALQGRVEAGRLHLDGELPFKPGSGGGGFNSYGGNVFAGGGSFSSMTIVNGRVSGGGGSTFIINGREVDLERGMQLVIAAPVSVNVVVRDLVGAVGITDTLDGNVDFSPSFHASLVAGQVGHLAGDVTGSGSAEVRHVAGDAELEVSGSGQFYLGGVDGGVQARISGSGSVTIAGGTSRSLRARVSGSGSIRHDGTVMGSADLKVSGSGSISSRKVEGGFDQKVTGSGTISVNGQTYRPRW